MFDYLGPQSKATSLIEKYGRSVTLVQTVNDVETSTKTTAVFVAADKTERDKSNIGSVRTECVLPGSLKVVPNVDDYLVRGSESYRVVDVMVIKPADTIVVYKLTVRR